MEMSLRQLHERLGQIIVENEMLGEGDRNSLPVFFEVRRGGRKQSHFYRIVHASSCETGMVAGGKKVRFLALIGGEESLMVPGK